MHPRPTAAIGGVRNKNVAKECWLGCGRHFSRRERARISKRGAGLAIRWRIGRILARASAALGEPLDPGDQRAVKVLQRAAEPHAELQGSPGRGSAPGRAPRPLELERLIAGCSKNSPRLNSPMPWRSRAGGRSPQRRERRRRPGR
jgi:hypothetical protein